MFNADRFSVVMDLKDEAGFVLGDLPADPYAVNRFEKTVKDFENDRAFVYHNGKPVRMKDISFLGLVANSSCISQVYYVGIYEGLNAHKVNWRPNHVVAERLRQSFGLSSEAFAEMFGNLSRYFLNGKLVTAQEALFELTSHGNTGYGLCEAFVKALNGRADGLIHCDLKSSGLLTIQTPADARMMSRELSLVHNATDKDTTALPNVLSVSQKWQHLHDAAVRIENMPDGSVVKERLELCIQNSFGEISVS